MLTSSHLCAALVQDAISQLPPDRTPETLRPESLEKVKVCDARSEQAAENGWQGLCRN